MAVVMTKCMNRPRWMKTMMIIVKTVCGHPICSVLVLWIQKTDVTSHSIHRGLLSSRTITR